MTPPSIAQKQQPPGQMTQKQMTQKQMTPEQETPESQGECSGEADRNSPSTQRTFKLELCFDGTAYHGWQYQTNNITVQEILEDRLKRLFASESKISVQGSSRTDSGVHALGMCASFRAPASPYIPDWKVQKALNRILPDDIRIRSAELVDSSFNARHDALAKSYVYVINTGDLNPFVNRYCWHLHDLTKVDEMREAIAFLRGTHDFSTFTVQNKLVDDPVRSILRAEVKCFGPLVCLYFLGDGFLYKMVRSMAGSLAFVGRGKLRPDDIRSMLESRDRLRCKDTAPARGLFLKKVFYRYGEWEQDSLEEPPFHTMIYR